MAYEELIIAQTRDYNPDTGANLMITYRGTVAEMDAVEAYWNTLNYEDGTPTGRGYTTTKTWTAMGYVLIARLPDNILYTTRWSLDTETTSVSIWWMANVRDYNTNFLGLDLSVQSDFLNYMRRIMYIEAAVNAMRAGVDPATVVSGGAFPLGAFVKTEYDLMFLIIKESGYVGMKRPVLKRNRLIPFAVPGKTTLVGPEVVYTTTALLNTFDVPDDIVDQVASVEDDLPATLPNFVWAWKQRRNDSEILVGFNRTTECMDWVFGNWSTIAHTVISL